MIYPKIEDYFNFIFNDIRNLVYDDTQKPVYEKDTNGLEKLSSILELIKNNTYYPTFYKKAAYLFIALSTGHYFENGNKRIALFSYLYFTHRNKYQFRSIRTKQYKGWLKKYFPKHRLSRHEFYNNIGWALYNLNKAINIKFEENKKGHKYNFDKLKEIMEEFFQFTSKRK